ncbi:hypothetical protein J6590_003213 [Homalodisca vitripennis]|nr:hypothetical protein J6590_003213 [Homalodisca vitripennis]
MKVSGDTILDNLTLRAEGCGQANGSEQELDPEHIVAVVREFTDCPEPRDTTLNDFKQLVVSSLPEDNVLQFVVPWKNSGIDTEWPEHDSYLSDFQDVATSTLQSLINKSIEERPEINAKTKQIQEVFKEALFHLALCNQYTSGQLPTVDWRGTETLEHIRSLMTNATSRHGPILVQGSYGAGKTSLLTTIYTECESWFGRKVMKVLRFSGITPRSSYNLELLRIICEQLCLLLQPSAHCVPQDASFDPLYVNNWFQTLIRRFDEESPDRDPSGRHLLVIMIDDIHRLNPLDSDIVAALSWLPINLPRNVHIIGTTHSSPDILKLTPVQRERFKLPDCYIELPPVTDDLEKKAEKSLEAMEAQFGRKALTRLGSMLTASEFGLSEPELLELLMPTSGSSTAELSLDDGYFNFSTFSMVRRKMKLDPEHIVAVVREFTDCPEPRDTTLNDFKQLVVSSLPEDNVLQFVVPWKNSGIDTEWPEHDSYLSDFQDVATSTLQSLINKSIEERPEINAKTKQIQEVFKEALFHLALCNQYTSGQLPTVDWRGTETLEHIRSLMTNATSRHGPILVQGSYGAGKTSLLTTIYTECESWFGRKVMKVSSLMVGISSDSM